MAQYDVVDSPKRMKVRMAWDANTALATIIVASVLTIAALRGSLKTAIQP